MKSSPHQMAITGGSGQPGDEPRDMILESMSQGVAVWDGALTLVAFNQRYAELMRFAPGFLHIGIGYADVLRHLAERGLYTIPDLDGYIRSRVEAARRRTADRHERTLADGRVLEIQRRPMPNGRRRLPLRRSRAPMTSR